MLHLLLQRRDVLRLRTLRVRGSRQRRVVDRAALTAETRRVAVGAEQTAQELADDRDRAPLVEHELGQGRRLIDSLANLNAGQRRDRLRELHGQRDRPLALVVARAGRAFARQQLDVVEHRITVERLTDVHPALPVHADGAVAQEMTEQARERERAHALVRLRHREFEVAGAQHVPGFVRADCVERRLEPHDHAVLAEHEPIGAHPLAVRPQELVVRRAGERAAVLQRQRHAVALALRDQLALNRSRERAIVGRAEHSCAAGARQIFDSARHAVRHEHRSTRDEASRAAVADEVEADLVELAEQVRRDEIVGDDLRAGRQARLHPRLAREALRRGVASDQARADHHGRVRRVRAARDRGDHGRAVLEIELRLARADGRLQALAGGFQRGARPWRPRPFSGMRSCGRFGPARLGSTDFEVEQRACRCSARAWRVRQRPCAFAYASTSAIVSFERPESSR